MSWHLGICLSAAVSLNLLPQCGQSIRLGSGADAMGAPPKAVTAPCNICSFVHSFIHSLIHSLMHSFIHSCIHSCIHSFIHSLMHSFVHSFIHSSVHPSIRSFTCLLYNVYIRSRLKAACWLQIVTTTTCTAFGHDEILLQAAAIHMIAGTLAVKPGTWQEPLAGTPVKYCY